MIRFRISLKGLILFVGLTFGCTHQEPDEVEPYDPFDHIGNGALLLPSHNSMESLTQAVTLHYSGSGKSTTNSYASKGEVILTHHVGQRMVTSILSKGVS